MVTEKATIWLELRFSITCISNLDDYHDQTYNHAYYPDNQSINSEDHQNDHLDNPDDYSDHLDIYADHSSYPKDRPDHP